MGNMKAAANKKEDVISDNEFLVFYPLLAMSAVDRISVLIS